jgi:hypothetical protein
MSVVTQLTFSENTVDALIEHHVSTYTGPSSGFLNNIKKHIEKDNAQSFLIRNIF